MKTNYRGAQWNESTTFAEETWESFDLTDTFFANTIFQRVTFRDCVFAKSNVEKMRILGCDSIRCEFSNVDLRHVAIGAEGGKYSECNFDKCDFRGQYFFWPKFEDCSFSDCRFQGANRNDSVFVECAFIGALADASFNGMYHRCPLNRHALENVDFENARLDDFVTFYDCDLSTCVPPSGRTFDQLLYPIFSNDSTVLSTGSKDRIVLERKLNGS